MTTLLMAGLAHIGVNAVVGTLKKISSTSKDISEIIHNIATSNHPEKHNIKEELKNIDIELTIKILESMLNEIPRDKIESKTILICLDSIKESVEEIQFELMKVKEIIGYNNSLKIFKSWRSYDSNKNIIKIKEMTNVLDGRMDLLFKLLQIKYDLKQDQIEMIEH